jgi:branched-chain amino acid transport system permease protein
MDTSALASALVTGTGLGCMYGLVALGYYITYAASRTVNFAQGVPLMLGAVGTFALVTHWHWPLALACLAAMVGCAVFGVAVERVAVRPFVRRGSESWLMATIAVGLIVENLVLFAFGRDPRGLANPLNDIGVDLAGLRVTGLQIAIPVAGLAITVLLAWAVRYTRYGRELRAVALNPSAAQLMGIEPSRIIVISYAISGLFAGLAGVLIAPLYTVSAGMGTMFGIKAFAAAILGGIGGPWSVMLGGLALGLAEACIIALAGSTHAQLLSFALVIVVLAVRPVGLFGRAFAQKV